MYAMPLSQFSTEMMRRILAISFYLFFAVHVYICGTCVICIIKKRFESYKL